MRMAARTVTSVSSDDASTTPASASNRMASAVRRWLLTSRKVTTAPATAPSISSGDDVQSAGTAVPSRRHSTVSCTRADCPSRNA